MKDLLKKMELLSSLSDSELDALSLFCQNKTVSKGETLFNEGDEAIAMYLLFSGEFLITKNIKGKDTKLGNVKAEEIIGEMALFGGDGKRMATATAVEDSELITILSFSINELSKKNPDLLKKIQDIINERIFYNKSIEENN